jgi:hypothetical protein
MDKKAFYTFPLNSGGVSIESDLIIEVGSKFTYWGKKWQVSSIEEEEDSILLINVTELI